MDIEELERELSRLNSEIEPLVELRGKLTRQRDTQKSIDFIAENKITRDQVQCPYDDGLPYFEDAYSFGDWLYCNTTKPWCLWNGYLYEREGFATGRLPFVSPGRYKDLPK